MDIFASPSRAPGQAGQTYNENWSETTMNHDAFDAHEPPHSLSVGEHLFLAGERNGVWQLSRGLVRLESVGPSGTSFVRLAMPGDLLGAECALHQPYAFNAVAVTDCEVTRVDTGNDMQRMSPGSRPEKELIGQTLAATSREHQQRNDQQTTAHGIPRRMPPARFPRYRPVQSGWRCPDADG